MSRADTERLTVIVPCFNEAGLVEETVAAIWAAAPALPVEVEVLLVDDGSTDDTAAGMARLCDRYPRTRMRRNPRNLGLGRSVLGAYADVAPGSWVTVIPGDNEFVFASVARLLEVRDRFDLVLGYLHNPVIRPLGRRLASSAFMGVSRFLYGFPYRYLNGMKLYRVEVFQGIDVISSGHAFNAELLAKALLRNPDLRIGEAPFVARGRSNGSSKAIRPRSVLRAVREVAAGHRSVGRYRNLVIGQDDDAE